MAISEEAQRKMFGATLAKMHELFDRADASEKLFTAMSILSDAQEAMGMGAQEKARQNINIAKWLIDEVRSTMPRS